MSWYLFKDTYQPRGIKVEGFLSNRKARVNLSWGMNQKPNEEQTQSQIQRQVIPATMAPPGTQQAQHVGNIRTIRVGQQYQPINNIKVLTDTSDEQQEELMKLMRQHNGQKQQRQSLDMYHKAKQRGSVVNPVLPATRHENMMDYQTMQRMKYLQNSLLPSSQKDNMKPILNHQLHRSVPLQQSRLSGRSIFHNKKNQSKVVLGDGYNVFTSSEPAPKELNDKLREMYQYEAKYKKRVAHNNVFFG